MKPDGRNEKVIVKAIFDENGDAMDSAPHPKQKLYIQLSGVAEEYDILRRQEK
jgi:putative protease